MISKANLGQQLALPLWGRGLMHSQLSTHCPFLGAGGLGDKRYRGVSLDPLHHLPQFFSSLENSKHYWLSQK